MDELWKRVGSWGRYQYVILASLPLAVIAAGGNFLISVFFVIEPKWQCTTGNEQTAAVENDEWTDNCTVFEACPAGLLKYQAEFQGINQDWGLLCDKDYIVHSIISMSNVPNMFALLMWGTMSDRWGRKYTALVSTLCMIMSSLSTIVAPSWTIFAALRMLFGFSFAGACNTFQVWAMESTDQDHGFLINALTHWHYTYMFVAILGWMTQNWKMYTLVVNLLCAPILLLYTLFFFESPRWLIQKGRLDEALHVFKEIGKQNGRDISDLTKSDLKGADPDHDASSSKTNYNFCSLFEGKKRAIYSCCLGFTFLTASIVSGTVILDIGQLAGGVYQNLFLLGMFRCLTPLVSVWLDWYIPNIGRRQFFLYAQALVVFCFLMVFSALTLHDVLPLVLARTLPAVFSLAGAITNMFVWIVIVQIAFEIYPTLLRNTGVAYTTLMDSFGAVLVPQIVYLRRFWAPAPCLVAISMIFITTTAGYCIFPETKDAAALHRSSSKVSSNKNSKEEDKQSLLAADFDEEDESENVII